MSKAIFSLNVGNNKMYIPTLKSIFYYAKKIGADFYVSNSIKLNLYNFYFEKLQCLELFKNKSYDQVLYIDADVLITPKSKNIFEEFPNPTYFYAHHENTDSPVMDRDRFVTPLLSSEFDWPKINGRYQYFNAGVMLFGRDCWFNLINGLENPPNNPSIWEFGDQTFINYLVVKNKINYGTLSREYNWMNCGEPDPNKNRFRANFIHYAGPSLYGNTKEEVILADYKELYDNQ